MISRALFVENKKLRILDFDDTLVKTKSLVYVIHKNGKKSKMTPGQYAMYEPKEGDEFDYSDFKSVKNPEEIKPMTSVLKRIIKSNKRNLTYILTARSAYRPIVKYLKTIGIDTNKLYVIALDSSDSKAKSDWIEKMIETKKFDDVYFADDSEKNVKAVKRMLRTKNVKSRVRLIKY